MRIKISTIIIFLSCLLFTSSPYLSQTVNNVLFLVVEVILILMLLQNGIAKRVFKDNIPIIVFWVITILCTFINLGFSSRTLNAFTTGLRYVVLFLTYQQLSIEDSCEYVIDNLYRIVFAGSILEDICIIVTGGNGIMSSGPLHYYLFGNKFGVSYLHMFVLALMLFHQMVNSPQTSYKRVFWAYWIYSVVICKFIDCNTGLIGVLVIGLIVFITGKNKMFISFFSRPLVFTIVFVGSTFLLVGTNILLNNSFIQDLFMRLSHTNKILTGRVDMYQIAILAIVRNPIIGYGINNTIVQDTLTWGNAQNGLLKMLLDYGVIGTVAFIFTCIKAITSNENTRERIAFPVLAFLYGMCICSMVEINIAGFFFAGLAIVHAIHSNQYE